jgi:hypothetical protein
VDDRAAEIKKLKLNKSCGSYALPAYLRANPDIASLIRATLPDRLSEHSGHAATAAQYATLLRPTSFASPAQRCRVHRIPPRVRDDRDTPLVWDETAALIEVIWVGAEQENFLLWDSTAQITPNLARRAADFFTTSSVIAT